MSTATADFGSDAWVTIVRFAKKLGGKGLEAALLCWAVATDPDAPAKARAAVVSALVYLGMPLDAIPDVTPVTGLTDDVAVLLGAISAVMWAVGPKHRAFADRWLHRWNLK